MEPPEIELTVGSYPWSKKQCIMLRVKGSLYVLARFDSPQCLEAFLALKPAYQIQGVDPEVLRRLLTDGS